MAATSVVTHLLSSADSHHHHDEHDHHHDEHEEATLVKKSSSSSIPPITYLYIVLCASANILFGYENSVIAQAKLDFSSKYPLSDDQTGFLTGKYIVVLHYPLSVRVERHPCSFFLFFFLSRRE